MAVSSVLGHALAARGNITAPNRLINGHFPIDQRNAGASQTITAAAALAYTVDRWYAYCSGANVTGQRVAGTAPAQYAYKFTGLASNTGVGFGQRVEQANSFDMAGLEASISVYMTASTAKTITWVLNGPSVTADTFGTIASPAVTQIATGTFAVTTTRTLFTVNLTAAQMAGFNKGLELRFTVPTLLGSETWTIELAKLEQCAAATPFVMPDISQETVRCQRYCEIGSAPYLYLGGTFSQTAGYGMVTYQVTKRAIPAITFTSWQYFSGGTPTGFTPTLASALTTQFNFQGTGLTNWNGWPGNGTWKADAEMYT